MKRKQAWAMMLVAIAAEIAAVVAAAAFLPEWFGPHRLLFFIVALLVLVIATVFRLWPRPAVAPSTRRTFADLQGGGTNINISGNDIQGADDILRSGKPVDGLTMKGNKFRK
jgi:hypothetical protein